MYKYRLAETRDLEALVRMSKDFYATSKDTVVIPYDEDSVVLLTLGMIEDGLVVVVYPSESEAIEEEEDQSPIVGAIAGAYFQSPINMHKKCVKEHMFWIDEEHRKGHVASTLLLVYQVGAKADDVDYVYMASLPTSPESVEFLYAKGGYTKAETGFVKEL